MKKYLSRITVMVVFAALWQVLAALMNRPFLPGPAETLAVLARILSEGKLWRHIGASLSRIGWALILSAVPALVLGLTAGRSPGFNKILSPVIYLLHPLPKAAFLPVIMSFFGLGEFSKIFLVAFIIFSQMLVTIRDAAARTPEELIDSVRSLGAGKRALLGHVIIPAVLPGFFTGLRVSLGTAIAVLFFAETFAAESGLGYLIADAWTRIAYTEMYAAILALSLLGLLLFAATDLAERLICPWLKASAGSVR